MIKKVKKLAVGHKTITVEVVSSPGDLSTGLMNRSQLLENDGMLFVYPYERRLSFWMKNTTIPLSIAFINKDGAITEIKNMTPESEKSVKSSRRAKFALEVNQGWFKKNSIKEGDIIDLSIFNNTRRKNTMNKKKIEAIVRQEVQLERRRRLEIDRLKKKTNRLIREVKLLEEFDPMSLVDLSGQHRSTSSDDGDSTSASWKVNSFIENTRCEDPVCARRTVDLESDREERELMGDGPRRSWDPQSVHSPSESTDPGTTPCRGDRELVCRDKIPPINLDDFEPSTEREFFGDPPLSNWKRNNRVRESKKSKRPLDSGAEVDRLKKKANRLIREVKRLRNLS